MVTRNPGAIPVLLMVRELGPGGTERQMTELALHLDPALIGVSVGCFHPGIRSADLEGAGIPVEQILVTIFGSPSAVTGARTLREYVKRNRVAILHTFDAPMNVFGVLSCGLVPMKGLKLITSQRGHRNLAPKLRTLLRVTDKLADVIVVNCEYLRQHLHVDEGVPMRKIRLCYNGLNPVRFYPERESGPFTIGVTCVLRAEKGLTTLVRAFAAVRHLRPEMRLCIVGSGAMLEELKHLASKLGVAADVHFEPATGDVRSWLNRMDVFVLPSLDEALSNSLMEAMACGCAVIASSVGGNPELVSSGETGLLFEKGNVEQLAARLRELIESPSMRQQLAAAGARRIAQEFSVDRSARRMEEIYSEVLGAKVSG